MANMFNLQRFRNLARWTWVMDKPYYLKSATSQAAIIAGLMQVPNLFFLISNDRDDSFLSLICFGFLFGSVVLGSSYMYMSFKDNPDGFRQLHMIPASNLEKFVLRYLMPFFIQVILAIVIVLAADTLQYLVGMAIGREPLRWAIADMLNASGTISHANAVKTIFVVMFLLWIHTAFMLGANLFRNVKYGMVFTLIAIFLLAMAVIAVMPTSSIRTLLNDHTLVISIIFAIINVFNVWFSYKLFCNRRHIGRFINWL